MGAEKSGGSPDFARGPRAIPAAGRVWSPSEVAWSPEILFVVIQGRPKLGQVPDMRQMGCGVCA